MSNIAIIPARSGSKRIPQKNIRMFFDKPVIAYSIAAAIESELFDKVMVSTDSVEIADIAKKFGAEIPFYRSAKNSDDYATTLEVLLEVLGLYAEAGLDFGAVCCIYPVAPLITANLLKDSFALLSKQDVDCVMPVCAYSHPIERSLVIKNNYLSYRYPNHYKTRSQDLEKSYHDIGMFYWMENEALTIKKTMVSDRTVPFIVDDLQCQDIDNEADWKLAELKYKLLMHVKK